jgi:PAT family beta-lactamase induction signal transducer AmpG
VLPFIKPAANAAGDGGGSARARRLAAVLALMCLMWLPYRAGLLQAGAAAPIFETLFTLVFVASAVFLAAGSAVLGATASTLGRLGLVMAPLLLAMYLRKWWPQLGALYYAVPLLAALVLAAQARLDWRVLRVAPPAEAA